VVTKLESVNSAKCISASMASPQPPPMISTVLLLWRTSWHRPRTASSSIIDGLAIRTFRLAGDSRCSICVRSRSTGMDRCTGPCGSCEARISALTSLFSNWSACETSVL